MSYSSAESRVAKAGQEVRERDVTNWSPDLTTSGTRNAWRILCFTAFELQHELTIAEVRKAPRSQPCLLYDPDMCYLLAAKMW